MPDSLLSPDLSPDAGTCCRYPLSSPRPCTGVHLRVSSKSIFLLAGLLALSLVMAPGVSNARSDHWHSLWNYSGTPESRVYADVQWGVQSIRHSDLNFYPVFASAGVGLWLFDNIGIETFGDYGLEAFKDGDFTVEIEEAGGVGLRFQSPPRRGLSAYVLTGYVDFQLSQFERHPGYTRRLSQGFGGFRLGLGLAQRLPVFDSVLVTAEYRNYFSQKEIQIDLLSVGFRVNLR